MPRVLITDDNSENRYFLEVLLQKNGFETVSATNGQDALAAAQASPPDLIVTDILMPVMDGFTLCRHWKSDDRLKRIPFVFYTATYTDTKDIEFGLSLGAERFLLKPMETEPLMRILREVLDEHGMQRQGTAEGTLETDMEVLRQYNEVLFRKLEKKMAALEQANLTLQEEIKERRSIEASLRRSEEKLKTLLDTLPVGLVLADAEDAIRYANSKFTELFGYTIEDVPTVEAWFLRACNGPGAGGVLFSAWGAAMETAGKTGEATLPFDARVACGDGTFKEISMIGAVVADVHLAIFTDITERKRLEQQLLQAHKLENIGNLAGGIAHDFNNVLTSITGFAGLLQMKMPGSDPLMHYVNEIAAAGMRGAALTHQLLAFSRKQILDIRPVDLNEILMNLQKMLQRLIREDIALIVKPLARPLPIMADANQIEQVVINLVTNARDAMPAGGPLDISTDIADVDALFVRRHGYGEIGRYAVITISDKGMGMDGETLQRIFEPFFTTKEVDKGTGLGLAVVYGIIRQHKGMIRVESEPGRGSTFTVYLPLLGGDSQVEKRRQEETDYRGGSETVLIAEDNEMLRKMTKDILAGHGYKVIVADDGRAAVTAFKKHRAEIDLIVLDLIMPGKRGFEAYGEISTMAPETMVLFVTGYSESEIESQEISRRKLPLLMKPYTPVDFLKKVRELLDRRANGQ